MLVNRRSETKVKDYQIEIASGETFEQIVNAVRGFINVTDSDLLNDLATNDSIVSELNTPSVELSNGTAPLDKEFVFEPFRYDNTYVNPITKSFDGLNTAFFGEGTNIIKRENLIPIDWMDRGGCESDSASNLHPMIKGEFGPPDSSNCVWGRDAAESFKGSYSYKLTKSTLSGGGDAFVRFVDNYTDTDLHGLTPGITYKFSAWIYIPTGGIQGTEISLQIGDAVSSSWETIDAFCQNVYEQWQYVELEKTIRPDAEGTTVAIIADTIADLNEYFYVDEVRFEVVGDQDYTYKWNSFQTDIEEASDVSNGSKFYKLTGHKIDSYLKTYFLFNSNGKKGFQALIKKGTANTLNVSIIEDPNGVPSTKLDIDASWITKQFTENTGIVHLYEWIDDETLWIGLITDTVDFTKQQQLRISSSDDTIDGSYSYWAAIIVEDTEYPTTYVFPNTTRKKKEINYELEMPSKFTIDVVFQPSFNYDTATDKCICSWYTDVTHKAGIFYSQADDKFCFAWQDGGTIRYLYTQQFDDGSSFDDINEIIHLIFSLDLTTGTDTGSEVWFGSISVEDTWSGSIDVKSSTFNNFLVGWQDGVTAESFIKRISVYDDVSVQENIDSNMDSKVILFHREYEVYEYSHRKDIEEIQLVDNYIDRGGCEWDNTLNYHPMVRDELGPPVTSNVAWTRDATESYRLDYSYKMMKNAGGAVTALTYLTDADGTTDLHNLRPGETYKFSAMIFVPNSSAPELAEIQMIIEDYVAGWNTDTVSPTTNGAWHKLEITRTIRSSATGIRLYFFIDTTASSGEFFYVDDIKLEIVNNEIIKTENEQATSPDPFGTKRGVLGFFSRTENLIISPEDFTDSAWQDSGMTSVELTDDYFNGHKLSKLTKASGANYVYQDIPNFKITNTTLSGQIVLRNGNCVGPTKVVLRDIDGTVDKTTINIYWDTKVVIATDGLIYSSHWFDNNTIRISFIANEITASNDHSLRIFPDNITDDVYCYTTEAFVENENFCKLYTPVNRPKAKLLYPFEWTEQGTIECWVRPMFNWDTSENKNILGFSHLASVDNRFFLTYSQSANKFCFSLTSSSGNYNYTYSDEYTTNYQLQQWIHLKITWDIDADETELLVNGEIQTDKLTGGTGISVVDINDMKKISIGYSLYSADREFDGYITDFMFKPEVDLSNEHYYRTRPYYMKNRVMGNEGNFKMDKFGNSFFRSINIG